MEHTSNYLKAVFRNLKYESKDQPALFFIFLALISIPLNHAFSSIAIGLLVFISIITFKKGNFHLQKNLLLPVALFLLMGLSLVWTNDFANSAKAIQKGVPLFIVPFCFMLLPKFNVAQKHKIMAYFSCGMLAFTIFWLIKATIRYLSSHDPAVFFYHELVTEDVNAIHVSLYTAISACYFMAKPKKSAIDKFALALQAVFLILLSSKNILIVFLALSGFHYFRNFRAAHKTRFLKWGLLLVCLTVLALMGKIKDRFLIEFSSNATENSINQEVGTVKDRVYNVSIKQAWSQDKFTDNDYFPGTAFRVYQIRIFKEMLEEDPIFFKGYGLNAVNFKIKEKGAEHKVFSGNENHDGYQNKNFHNEYVQLFAEVGVFGLLLLLLMLFLNLTKALKAKDFMHISFAVLMISLFLTESFLSRQRGIMFFTILYCLFNAESSNDAPTLKNKT
jgi:O-antigen ligase